MVEAAIAVPVIILAAMLMLRMFVFCLDVLSSSVKLHLEALKESDAYQGKLVSDFSVQKEVVLARSGLLNAAAEKTIKVEMPLYNEDYLVRTNEVVEK